MRFTDFLKPKHTAASVVRQLAEGLRDGTIVLHEPEDPPGRCSISYAAFARELLRYEQEVLRRRLFLLTCALGAQVVALIVLAWAVARGGNVSAFAATGAAAVATFIAGTAVGFMSAQTRALRRLRRDRRALLREMTTGPADPTELMRLRERVNRLESYFSSGGRPGAASS